MGERTREGGWGEDGLVAPVGPTGRTAGRVIALIWLFYLADPFVAAWQEPNRLRGGLGVVSLVVFAGLYAWHFLITPLPSLGRTGFRPSPGPQWPGMLRYAGLAVCAATATVLVGRSAAATWVFLAISGIWALTGWWPFVAAVALGGGYELAAYRLDSWDRDSSLVFGLAVAVIAVTSMTIAVGRSRDLAVAQRENARLAVEEERNRVARDLHDILGHSLTVIRIKAELAARLVELDPVRAREEVEAVEGLAREALADVRGRSKGSVRSRWPARSRGPGPPWSRRASSPTSRASSTASPPTCASSTPGPCARGSPTSSGTAARARAR
ncbi:hypothetical protein G7075_09145 [Phycicoccus sp. HDW14]|uniref:sensor histidine kinase n=1 Tax=Phycicoccus sp. HDW14 TaxID=2714941 RepID=UPI001409C149|nr:histidine kinase [Phycicoccus sp. HDW14]QIM21260.1 hypothetical protein G7075_09145 [Phycicoccus sp. HDW14]